MVKVYGVRWSALPNYRQLLVILREDWREIWWERYKSVRDERKNRTSLAGLLLLQWSGADGALRYDPVGRPYFMASDVDFNITHTRNLIVCAVDFGGEDGRGESPRVGVDAENLSRVSLIRTCPLAERWFTEKEREVFYADPTDKMFLRIWTCKEALVKWTGEGLRKLRTVDTTCEDQYGVRFTAYEIDDAVVTVCSRQGARVVDAVQMMDMEFHKVSLETMG